jgi:hypothetical protein
LELIKSLTIKNRVKKKFCNWFRKIQMAKELIWFLIVLEPKILVW